jgi:chemotaxis protein CheD
MNPVATELAHFHLKPGELLVTREALLVVTVLGSCVAITMFDAGLGLAAICHAMLPRPGRSVVEDSGAPGQFKYLIEVVPVMAERFRSAGSVLAQIEVKLFGGGNVIGTRNAALPHRGLGTDNVRFARELLRSAGLSVKAANIGGNRGRKILFNTGTGEVLHKHLIP